MSDPTDDLARRIADCLAHHLHEFGFEPYRYPSGENKSVRMVRPCVVELFAAGGGGWEVEVRPHPALSPAHAATDGGDGA